MERQKVYCELAFVKNFVNSFPHAISPSEASIQEQQTWNDFNAFIFRSNIQLDISVSEFGLIAKQEEYYKYWWKRSAAGECNLEFSNNNFPDIETLEDGNDHYSSVYLTTKPTEVCQHVADSFGVIVVNSSNISSSSKIFQVHLESVKKGSHSHNNWDFLGNLKHPCNSLAIVDNYILKDRNVLKENLIAIIDQLLPESLKIDFHISIFSMNEFNNDQYLELIKQEVQRLRPKLPFKLTIHKIHQGSFHDRSLITNYLICDSGSGFDLFKKRSANHQTKVIGFFAFAVNNMTHDPYTSYHDLRHALKKMRDNVSTNPNFINCWGDNMNRLLN